MIFFFYVWACQRMCTNLNLAIEVGKDLGLACIACDLYIFNWGTVCNGAFFSQALGFALLLIIAHLYYKVSHINKITTFPGKKKGWVQPHGFDNKHLPTELGSRMK